MLLPPSKKSNQTKARDKGLKNKFGLRASASSSTRERFVSDFLEMYTETVLGYLRKNKLPERKSIYNNSVSKNLIRSWYAKMSYEHDFPFPVDSDEEMKLYYKIDVWKSALEILFEANSVESVAYYIQSVNGIFKYVASSRMHLDQRKLDLKNSARDLYPKNIKKFSTQKVKRILGAFLILVYEQATGYSLRRSKDFYRVSGYLEVDNSYPRFKKDMLIYSSLVREMIIEFEPFYQSMIEYYEIDDFLNYGALLKFVSQYPSDHDEDIFFVNLDPKNIEAFIKKFVGLVYDR